MRKYEAYFYSKGPRLSKGTLPKVYLVRKEIGTNQYGGLIDAEDPDEVCVKINEHYVAPRINRIREVTSGKKESNDGPTDQQ